MAAARPADAELKPSMSEALHQRMMQTHRQPRRIALHEQCEWIVIFRPQTITVVPMAHLMAVNEALKLEGSTGTNSTPSTPSETRSDLRPRTGTTDSSWSDRSAVDRSPLTGSTPCGAISFKYRYKCGTSLPLRRVM